MKKYTLNGENLFEALFLTTVKCNAKCIFCCETGTEEDSPIDEMLKYIDPLVNKLGVKIIDMNGGEPLLRNHRNILQLMEKVNLCGARSSISSNIIALKNDFIKEMKPYVRAK